jgi:hypothetical protein
MNGAAHDGGAEQGNGGGQGDSAGVGHSVLDCSWGGRSGLSSEPVATLQLY